MPKGVLSCAAPRPNVEVATWAVRSRTGTESAKEAAIPVIAEAAAHLTVFQRTPNFSMPSRNDTIVYELHIGTFARQWGKGTWHAALEKLDYLAGLGVNVLEVMPEKQAFGPFNIKRDL